MIASRRADHDPADDPGEHERHPEHQGLDLIDEGRSDENAEEGQGASQRNAVIVDVPPKSPDVGELRRGGNLDPAPAGAKVRVSRIQTALRRA